MKKIKYTSILSIALIVTGLHASGQNKKEEKVADIEKKANMEYNMNHLEIDDDYQHASDEAYENWMDRRFGMRIHWGVYSQLGLDATWPTLHASDEFKDIYSTLWQVLIPWNSMPKNGLNWAEDAGMKYFVFYRKTSRWIFDV